MQKKKKILVLGSTGSIGTNTLDVLRRFPEKFTVTALTANNNINLLAKQIAEFKPEAVVVGSETKAESLKNLIDYNGKILIGENGLIQATKDFDYDILLSALVGFAGLLPTIEGIKRGKRIALANKETLVVAGEIITNLCKEYSAEIIPVDSEHSAIFQCLVGEQNNEVDKLIITASGGPFLNLSSAELDKVTVEQALNHPNWEMGNKVTIDSATMMNKGLEVMEAYWLFGFDVEKIEVVIQPQSIIHSFVQFVDGSIKAQIGTPDMRLPIQYALSYPERFNNTFVQTDFPKIGQLTFFEPDLKKYKCLQLAFNAINTGGTTPCILNAANEIAVDKFLKNEISFTEIPILIESALNKIENHTAPNLETIFECDTITRELLT